jgi:ABC-type multidrug transport system fused ATPase/permease subunit
MLNQNGINNDQSQKVLKEGVQFQDQTITYLNKNQNDTNEITNTLTDKPLISPEREMDEDEYFEEEVKKSNLVFEEKNISPVKLYLHLSGKCEIILMILGTICALGAGVAAPLMCYLFGDMANDFSEANIDENQMDILKALMDCNSLEEAMALAGGNADRAWSYGVFYTRGKELFQRFEDNVTSLIRKLLIIGASMFVAFGGQKFFWSYCGMRQMHHLKEKYFAVILRQEQGWFDANNAYEFSTKVQAQFERIALGVGEKFGLLLQAVSQIICGIIIAFYKSWLLTLVMLALSPTIFACVILLVCLIRKPMIGSRKTYEKAGGAAQEMLYNIKTIASFSNFEFEI